LMNASMITFCLAGEYIDGLVAFNRGNYKNVFVM